MIVAGTRGVWLCAVLGACGGGTPGNQPPGDPRPPADARAPGDGAPAIDGAVPVDGGVPDDGDSQIDASPIDAGAAACCVRARPSFIKLAEGTLTRGALVSDPIPVGAYTEVVVYITASLAGTGPCPGLDQPQFRGDPSLPFAATGRVVDIGGFRGGRLPVDGSDLRLSMPDPTPFTSCTSASYHYIVAAVQ